MWQWFRFLLSQVPKDKKVLLLNLDETSIRFWYEPRRGLRTRARHETPGLRSARQASRSAQRKALTHVAIICNDPSLQPLLPQVILANKHIVTLKSFKEWQALPGCSAELWRNKSAWINNDVFADIIKKLGEMLKAHAPDRQAILLMDAHSCHFCQKALAAARVKNIWVCIIPASTTGMLQPLDTHVFARFKMFLRTRLHQVMLTGPNRDLNVDEVLDALMLSMKGVLQKHKWDPTFSQNGFGQNFEVRKHLLTMMQWTSPPPLVASMPSYEQFKHCFPKGRFIPFMQLLTGVLPRSERPAKRVRPQPTTPAPIHDEPQPWSKRLRPRMGSRAITAQIAARRASAEPRPLEVSSSSVAPHRPMMSTSGDALPSLRRFPPLARRSRSAFLDDTPKC